MNRNKKGYRVSFSLILCVIWLISACAQRKSLDAYVQKMKQDDPVYYEKIEKDRLQRRAERTEVMGVSITCIVHGDIDVGFWYVEEVAHGQITRGMVGGSFTCGGVLALGYPIPLRWKPGLKVKVRWSTYGPDKKVEPTRHEKETTILPYSTVGSVYVHFFPGDEVRIVVANNDAISPFHPIPRNSVVPPLEIE